LFTSKFKIHHLLNDPFIDILVYSLALPSNSTPGIILYTIDYKKIKRKKTKSLFMFIYIKNFKKKRERKE
jgi:hypothetical protein